VHAHFAHDPALVALLLKKLTGLRYSFTAHARDLYQTQPFLLRERIADAEAVVACCRTNLDYLTKLSPDEKRQEVTLIHHGVDSQTFRPSLRPRPRHIPVIVAAGRLVEKKGFHDLIDACGRLRDDDHSFHCVVYGDGPLFEDLLGTITDLGLGTHVSLAGATTQHGLAAAFQQADVFSLTPYMTSDGDRDGIPNVLLEAMACGLPAVTTSVGGITEVVVHDHNGLLAGPRDVTSIAAHLAALLTDENRRLRLGQRARQTVVDQFDPAMAAHALVNLFAGPVEEHA
jgi:glycosyltransferase involved in cell wall biosynthesis